MFAYLKSALYPLLGYPNPANAYDYIGNFDALIQKYSEFDEPYKSFVYELIRFNRAIQKQGGFVEELKIGPPATESEIDWLESQLSYSLPKGLKELLLKFSKDFAFEWWINGNKFPDEEFPTSTLVRWNFDSLLDLDLIIQDLNGMHPHRRSDLAPFLMDSEGNKISLELTTGGNVVNNALYEDDELYVDEKRIPLNNLILAHSLPSFLTEMARVGFAYRGSEWINFLNPETLQIDANAPFSKKWRTFLALDT